MSRRVYSIAAMDSKRGIGKNSDLPWRLRKEFKYFVSKTLETKDLKKQNAVILGRLTWLSIPENFRPFKNRLNVVLSRKLSKSELPEGVLLEPDLAGAMETLSEEPYLSTIENIFVIGGAGVYEESIKSGLCCRIYLTKVQGDFSCDVFFPNFDQNIYKEVYLDNVPREEQEENGIKYTFHVYEKGQ